MGPEGPELPDRSNGWEAAASALVTRSWSPIGVAAVQAWADGLPAGGSVLDLGCGPGTPRSEVLARGRFALHAIDAAPRLAGAYAMRFPQARVACEAVEESTYFGTTFDGILAWGLFFLLPAETQLAVVGRVARALKSPGRLLFTAPAQRCSWNDLTTGRPSLSLGAAAYRSALDEAGLTLVGEYEDEGENHYYDAVKP